VLARTRFAWPHERGADLHGGVPTGKPAPDFESAGNRLKPEEYADFPNGSASGAALESEIGISDPDLAVIIERWESLPGAVRAGIVAMVSAACEEEA